MAQHVHLPVKTFTYMILILNILLRISLYLQLSVHLLVRMAVCVTIRGHVCVCLDSQERPANNVSLIKSCDISVFIHESLKL